MSTFTLAISCLTTSNLPWLVGLTFQVSIYCCLQHWTLFLSPVTTTTGCCFCFDSVSSFFLELFFHWFQICAVGAYWAPTDLGSSSFIVLSFCLFILYSLGSGVDCIQVPIQPYISSAVSYLDFPCFSFLSCRTETHSSLFVFFFSHLYVQLIKFQWGTARRLFLPVLKVKESFSL